MPDKNGNVRHLLGMECPRCHQAKRFEISVHGTTALTDEGTPGGVSELEWSEQDACMCVECEFDGIIDDFKLPGKNVKRENERMRRQLQALCDPARRLIEYLENSSTDPYVVIQLGRLQRAVNFHRQRRKKKPTTTGHPPRTRRIDVSEPPQEPPANG